MPLKRSGPRILITTEGIEFLMMDGHTEVLCRAECDLLREKFGREAFAVSAIAEENPELKLPLISGAPWIQAEVVYCARHEMAVTIEDGLTRRI